MVALFDDVSVFHYQDDISALDGGKSVGYDEAGAAFHHGGECVLDLDLGTGIDGGGCLIEDQHGGTRLIKLWAWDALAAAMISSSVASGLPMQMLSRIVPERNQVSCSTIP